MFKILSIFLAEFFLLKHRLVIEFMEGKVMTVGFQNYNYAVPSYTGYQAQNFQGAQVMPQTGYTAATPQKKSNAGKIAAGVAIAGTAALTIAAYAKGKNVDGNVFKKLGAGFASLWNSTKGKASEITNKIKDKFAKTSDTQGIAKTTTLTNQNVENAVKYMKEDFGEKAVNNMSDIAYFHNLGKYA